MRNIKTKANYQLKKHSGKCVGGVVKSFNKIQDEYTKFLDKDENVVEYQCNFCFIII